MALEEDCLHENQTCGKWILALMPWMFLGRTQVEYCCIWIDDLMGVGLVVYILLFVRTLDSVLFHLMHNLLLFKTKGFQSRNCLNLVCLHFAEWVLEYLSSKGETLHSKHIYSLVIVTHSNHDQTHWKVYHFEPFWIEQM